MLDNTLPATFIRHVEHLIENAEAGRLTDVDAIRLCDLAASLSGNSIVSARWREDQNAVGVLVKRVTNDRLIEVLDFAAVVMMAMAGLRLEDVSTKQDGKVYSYLRIEHPTDTTEDMRIRLNRIIIDAPPDQAVTFVIGKDFRDYRRANLKLRAPIAGMQEPKLGRAAAIKLARDLYETNSPAKLEHISPDEYEAMLNELFNAADKYHAPA